MRMQNIPDLSITWFEYTWNVLSMPRNSALNSEDLIGTWRAKNWSTVCNQMKIIHYERNCLSNCNMLNLHKQRSTTEMKVSNHTWVKTMIRLPLIKSLPIKTKSHAKHFSTMSKCAYYWCLSNFTHTRCTFKVVRI